MSRITLLIIKNACRFTILYKESKNLTEDMKKSKQDVDPAVVKDMSRLTKRMTKLQEEMEGDKISDDAFKVILFYKQTVNVDISILGKNEQNHSNNGSY